MGWGGWAGVYWTDMVGLVLVFMGRLTGYWAVEDNRHIPFLAYIHVDNASHCIWIMQCYLLYATLLCALSFDSNAPDCKVTRRQC